MVKQNVTYGTMDIVTHWLIVSFEYTEEYYSLNEILELAFLK